jgi:glycine oxidase
MDRGDLGRAASWAGAGILPPADPERAHSPFERLRAHSIRLYPGLSHELRERTGLDNGYRVCGGIEVPDPDEPVPSHEWHGEGVTVREVSGAELRAIEPGLAPEFVRGLHIPDMAQVRNPRHLRALIAACELLHVKMMTNCRAVGFLTKPGRVVDVIAENGPMKAGRYLIASGAWTDELLAPLGWHPGVHPVRGQIALLNDGTETPRPLILCGKRYLVPRGDGLVLVGATEEDAGYDARPTAEGVGGLIAFAVRLMPGLGRAAIERCWAGLRPGSPDGLPYLGSVPGFDNLFVASGHFRSGLQLSPASGLAMAQLLLGRKPFVSLEAFRLDRRS